MKTAQIVLVLAVLAFSADALAGKKHPGNKRAKEEKARQEEQQSKEEAKSEAKSEPKPPAEEKKKEGPKEGQYAPGHACLGSTRGINVDLTATKQIGAAHCKSALAKDLVSKVCKPGVKETIEFEYNYGGNNGFAKLYCK